MDKVPPTQQELSVFEFFLNFGLSFLPLVSFLKKLSFHALLRHLTQLQVLQTIGREWLSKRILQNFQKNKELK